MGRLLGRLVQGLFSIAVLAILAICLAFAIMQTQWAKGKIEQSLVTGLKLKGIDAKVSGVNGQLPFAWTVDHVELKTPDGKILDLQGINLRIAFFPLLKKHFAINYLKIEKAHYAFYEKPSHEPLVLSLETVKQAIREEIQDLSPLWHLSVHTLIVNHCQIENLSNHQVFVFALNAKGKWRKDNREFFLHAKISLPSDSKLYAELIVDGDKKEDQISTDLKVHIDEIERLRVFYPLNFDGILSLESTLSGSWTTWEEILWNKQTGGNPLSGTLQVVIDQLNVPLYPTLNGDWLLDSRFSLTAQSDCYIHSLNLSSEIISLKAKAALASHIQKSKAIVDFNLPNLSLFSQLAGTDLSGKGSGKAFYDRGQLKCSFLAEPLIVDSYQWEKVQNLITANLEGNRWDGLLKTIADKGVVPFNSEIAFEWIPNESLELSEIHIAAEEAALSGHLTVHFPYYNILGSLYGQISHLNYFAHLTGDEHLEGSIAAELNLWNSVEHNALLQNGRLELIATSFRYFDILADEVLLNADLVDIHHFPHGKIDLSVEKINTPRLFVKRGTLFALSDHSAWDFDLQLNGTCPEDCLLKLSGNWSRCEEDQQTQELCQNSTDPQGHLTIDQFSGIVAKNSFELEEPFTTYFAPDYFEISPFNLQIGKGIFSFDCRKDHEYLHAQLSAKHFPLEVLSVLRPQFSLYGSLTASGFVEGNQSDLNGSLNAILEQADFTQIGKKEPLKAKGSLQAHLGHNVLQIHSDLRASGKQFLDFSATVPIDYHLSPFHLSFNEQNPVSGELIAEGKIQDIFDFVNLGTNYFTGFVNCRLLLSNTLNAPSLRGDIDWKNGSYNNYYTGTYLREIDAHLEADQDRIDLISLEASDDDTGDFFAEGTIYLKPSEHFPYEFSSELDHVHVLHFDLIDCDLSGPLYFTGNAKSALAQGNLAVTDATIQIPDQLPYEIPELPVKFINRPLYLSSAQLTRSPAFPFRIDLDLTAENDIKVEGKGLNSDWEGSVHVSGVNSVIAAEGTLKLIKGEYGFSGKIFKLTEGQITFNDKPTPSANLQIEGILSLSDVEITAHLQGPLTSPLITFQSNPHLPTSSILARILFNKDIGEINQAEAIQLASALMSLSGGAGPNVLEAIRKSLGVDRLTIVSSQSGSDGVAVQIGKYLTKGVMVTLSQSATSSQVIVEVELYKGFIFQAETQEEEEGKFSLKWRASY